VIDKDWLSKVMIKQASDIARDEYKAFFRGIDEPMSQSTAIGCGHCRSQSEVLAQVKIAMGVNDPEVLPLRDALKKTALQVLQNQLGEVFQQKVKAESESEIAAAREQEELDELIYLDELGGLKQGGFA
jgi:hypothetical protein